MTEPQATTRTLLLSLKRNYVLKVAWKMSMKGRHERRILNERLKIRRRKTEAEMEGWRW